VKATTDGVHKRHHGYADRSAGNLAYTDWSALLDGITHILTAAIPLLRPDGIVVVTARPVR
jgi:hypothetical protein